MTEPTRTVDAVWTDFGGVLTPPVSETMAAFCRKKNLDPAPLGRAIWKVTQSYGTTDIMEPLDTPLVSERDWLRQVTDAMFEDTGIRVEITSMGEDWFDGRAVNEPWLAALRKVRERGIFVGMLSNMPPAWDVHWRAMVPPEDLFDDVVLSFEAGLRKPVREIFDLATSTSGIEPERSVFIDDLAVNCAGAQDAGWHSIHFQDTDEAIRALEALTTAPVTTS
ncbi:HAD family hydrolase [Actinoalloteichus hymeniacidonis]|uniref:Haloacid dehalogenase superfamily protein, subfamily IA, variant 3 with third motif having DD or ED n=1 Tax=Actinoalloteichus hymeniacidonis TaxID=340345 RepID=A0AAC9HUA7_9PSEU|nr:HAD family phosphatase [Actinoalloteichus hymeniacidonis]AOS65598.1 hypothetical protein TL08_24100 [Actinoalloteichus hymeniacidonis]MBB5906312.1 putative hydrolase of the HAD superfamily [Actinoalloteichus hymeniacidonis]